MTHTSIPVIAASLRRLPRAALTILRWPSPRISLIARLELIRLLFVDAFHSEKDCDL